MIACVSLNPCLDKAARVEAFRLDAPNRVTVERTDVGGKGVNVARALAALGGEAKLFGFDYLGAPIAGAMESSGVPCALEKVAGEMRVNLKLVDESTGRTLEISERGPAISPKQLQAVTDALLRACAPGDWAALSGSLPPGADLDTYGCLCAALREKGCHVAVDCDGPALAAALTAAPSLIKPNAHEFHALTGVDPSDEMAALAACRALHGRGIEAICLSRGAAGALLSTRAGAFFCPAAPVPPRGVQGAGDTMLAGLLLAMTRGMEGAEALRFASAAAGASVMRPGTLLCRREDAEALLGQLRVRPL